MLRAGLWESEVQLAAYKNVDYAKVMQIAEEQSVLGLITAGLEHVTDVKMPQTIVLEYIGATLQIEQRNKEMNAFIEKLINRLHDQDVYTLLIKGQGIAQCYERPLWRASGDIDLLLSTSNYERAKGILLPLATDVETEYSHFKHQGLAIYGWVVELHGTQHSRLSRRIDNVIDEAQHDVFYSGSVRSWMNGKTQVFIPSPDNDVVFVFTHILHHFFFEGIGLRQICDWCRLLWTYKEKINVTLLERRLKKMGVMSEWRAFSAFAVEYLGMPVEAMPFYSAENKWKKKAKKIELFILEVGNFGHKQRRDYSGMSYLKQKFISFRMRLSDMLRHFTLFPKDSIFFLWRGNAKWFLCCYSWRIKVKKTVCSMNDKLLSRLKEFMENETKSCFMDFGVCYA